jgi:MFS family permease
MMPARYRDRVDLAVNGTYWAGALIGTTVTLALLNHLSPDLGWRMAFFVGPALGLCIILVRRHLPESPRWLIMHGREKEAIAVFFAIAQGFGSLGSHLYGHLIGNGSDPNKLYVGYLIGAGAMIAGAPVEAFLGVNGENRSLEDVASPLSMVGRPGLGVSGIGRRGSGPLPHIPGG